MFPTHTIDTAPEESRPTLSRLSTEFGAIPEAAAKLAGSPELLNGFLAMSASFESCTLDPLARETVIMTVAVRNGCQVCIAMHTGKLRKLGADAALIGALRQGTALEDERLEAVRLFALAVLADSGAVDDEEMAAFLKHGYTERNALEVVFGIGVYTMSTLANRLVRA